MRVYLAGGMKSGWQEKVKGFTSTMKRVQWFDPTEHDYGDPRHYGPWDAAAVDACDVVFAYLEAGNPGGEGMCAEIGRAAGLGKVIIFVDEKTESGAARTRYLRLVREWSTVVVGNLSDGINHLQRYSLIF